MEHEAYVTESRGGDAEREDLLEMLRGNGWMLFEQAIQGDCAEEIRQAALDTDSMVSLQKLRWALVRHEAARVALAWPKERIAALDRQRAQRAQEPTLSRRGTL